MIGVVIISFWLFMALFGPRIVPYDVNYSDPGVIWKGPSARHFVSGVP
jgi:hypothetical protein